jgi:hypothetical protein
MPQLDPTQLDRPNRDGQAKTLTRREWEVADLITQGLSNEQIAQRLVVTPGTVANSDSEAELLDGMAGQPSPSTRPSTSPMCVRHTAFRHQRSLAQRR